MVWTQPKLNWTNNESVTEEDLNRIEGNLAHLRNLVYFGTTYVNHNAGHIGIGESHTFPDKYITDALQEQYHLYDTTNTVNTFFGDVGWYEGSHYTLQTVGDYTVFTNLAIDVDTKYDFMLPYYYLSPRWKGGAVG